MESIKLTNGEIEGIMQATATMDMIKKQLPLKSAYWLARTIDKMKNLYKVFKAEQQTIIKEHAQLKEDGSPQADDKDRVMWTPGQEEMAGEKLKELSDIEVDLGISKIDIS